MKNFGIILKAEIIRFTDMLLISYKIGYLKA